MHGSEADGIRCDWSFPTGLDLHMHVAMAHKEQLAVPLDDGRDLNLPTPGPPTRAPDSAFPPPPPPPSGMDALICLEWYYGGSSVPTSLIQWTPC